jgi:mono/diheme cytochrome c family protein/plastocyanin
MADNVNLEKPPKAEVRLAWFNNHQETLARIFVLALLLVVLAVPILNLPAKESLEVHSSQALTSGWDPDVIRAEVGQPLHLRFTSDDVVHGFGIGQTAIQPVDILPGEWTEITLLFDKPGVYTFYCTRWCGKDHWRMRGTLEVGEPNPVRLPPKLPLYVTLGLDLDKPHPSPIIPAYRPSATTTSENLSSQSEMKVFLSSNYYRSHSPFELFEELEDNVTSDSERWSIVASIWRSNASSEELAEGKKLFTENCAACHGTNGKGDGVFADDLEAQEKLDMESQHGYKKPASLNDPRSILGASPTILHGKIMRGGMGSGMPMWGIIFTEDQIWNLVAYIYSLMFVY